MKKTIATTKAPGAVGAYSQAIEVNGFVYVSGQIPLDPSTMKVVDGGIKEQATRSMENLKAILEEAGCGMEDIVKTTVLLDDINDFAAANEVYASYMKEPFPARACFEVSKLPLGVMIEIEAIAAKK